MFTWLKNLFASAKKDTLVLTEEVKTKKAAPAKKKAAPRKAAAPKKAPAKRGRPKKS